MSEVKEVAVFIRADKVFGDGAKGYVVGWFRGVELAQNIHAAKFQKTRMMLERGQCDNSEGFEK